MKLLELSEISKQFEVPEHIDLFSGINLSLSMGESIAIVGASGEGKSTLLHIAAGLLQPTSGLIKLGQEILTPKNSAKLRLKNIGFVFQGFHLIHGLTLLENLLIPVQIANLSTKTESPHYKRAHALLEEMGLDHRSNHPVHLLSGGEKQRAAIARALMLDPPLLFADEPTGNLDRKNSEAIHKLLLGSASQGRGIMIATHSRALANQCDRKLVIENGAISDPALI